jgi:uncharacterized protein
MRPRLGARSTESTPFMQIRSPGELRALYAQPLPRVLRKEIVALDRHCIDFISLSPFVVLATADAEFNMDASPRGGDPGFVKVTPEGDLLLPDAPGNNRLDSLQNILNTGHVGLLFMIPGFDETLRVNGTAIVSVAESDLRQCANERRTPKLVIRVTVKAAFLHCAKAFMRSKLWSESRKVPRTRLPTIGQMIGDQTGVAGAVETREEMERRYAPDL